MTTVARICALLVGISFALALSATPLAPTARAEIDGLLARLGSSGCEFNRNGSWHSAPEAVQHLKRKLAYLEDHDLVASAEQFIERAATSSSLSGDPYLVRCGSAAPVKSNAWMRDQLSLIRKQGTASR